MSQPDPADLQAQIDALTAANADLTIRLAGWTDTAIQLQSDNTALEDQLTQASTDRDLFALKAAGLQHQLDQANQVIASIPAQLMQARDQALADIAQSAANSAEVAVAIAQRQVLALTAKNTLLENLTRQWLDVASKAVVSATQLLG